ncbi:MAG: PAS domain-containing protein [Burkholderiales bacterium]
MVEQVVVLLIAAIACICFYASSSRARERAQRLKDALEELSRENYSALADATDTSIVRFRDSLRARSERLAELKKRIEETETALHESQNRNELTVHSASDGLWEWDLRTGKTAYSPRWKTMLGYSQDEIADSIEEWKTRIHADDFAAATAALSAHLDGASSHYQSDHRLRQRDGSYRWIMARGAAIRHASGKAYRFVGLNTDISEIKRAQQVLTDIATGISSARGKAFFQTLVKSFATTLNVHRAFVTECIDYPATRVRIKAYWAGGEFVPNKEFELAGTACEEVIHQGKICLHRSNFSALFPKEAFLGEESYCGMPIFSSLGSVIGHIALYDKKPMNDEFVIEPVFKIFATRAGSEMERLAAEVTLAIEKSLSQGLLDNISEAVITADAAGRVVYLNRTGEKMTGMSRIEAFGRPLGQVFHALHPENSGPVHNALARCLAQRVPTRVSARVQLVQPDGRKILVQQWAASFVDGEGKVTGGVLLFNHAGASLEIPLLASLHAA